MNPFRESAIVVPAEHFRFRDGEERLFWEKILAIVTADPAVGETSIAVKWADTLTLARRDRL